MIVEYKIVFSLFPFPFWWSSTRFSVRMSEHLQEFQIKLDHLREEFEARLSSQQLELENLKIQLESQSVEIENQRGRIEKLETGKSRMHLDKTD